MGLLLQTVQSGQFDRHVQ